MREEFRIAAGYRRCGIYFAMGTIAAMAALTWNAKLFEGQVNWGGVIVVGLLFGGATALWIWWSLHARLAIDADGVHVRVLGAWRTWTWEDFASGYVQNATGYVFVDPRRPWGQRRLSLAWLSDADGEAVLRACLEHWVPPGSGEVPDSIALSLRGWRRRGIHIRLRNTGIEVLRGHRLTTFRWDDVQELVITRLTRSHRDFATLVIKMPRELLVLKMSNNGGKLDTNWKGPEAAAIAEYLERHVPPERISYGHLLGDVASREDLKVRIAAEEYRAGELRQGIYFCGLIAGIWIAYFSWKYGGKWNVVLVAGLCWLIPATFIALGFHIERQKCLRGIASMKSDLDALDAQEARVGMR